MDIRSRGFLSIWVLYDLDWCRINVLPSPEDIYSNIFMKFWRQRFRVSWSILKTRFSIVCYWLVIYNVHCIHVLEYFWLAAKFYGGIICLNNLHLLSTWYTSNSYHRLNIFSLNEKIQSEFCSWHVFLIIQYSVNILYITIHVVMREHFLRFWLLVVV